MDIPEDLRLKNKPVMGRVFMDMPCGAALHRLLCDEVGRPIDYVTMEVNAMYEALTGTRAEEIEGVRASETLSNEELKRDLGLFAPVALEGRPRHYAVRTAEGGVIRKGTAVCPRPGFFFLMFLPDGIPLPVIPLL